MKKNINKLVLAAMLASLTCVATLVIKLPSPLNGYLNLGDCVVLLSGWLLSPPLGFAAAGIGSCLADLFLGYPLYMPATFIIKGLMAVIAHLVFKTLKVGTGARIISGLCAEAAMVIGYYVFEGFIYGFLPSAVNIPANAVQGAAGIVIGTLLIKLFEKSRFIKF